MPASSTTYAPCGESKNAAGARLAEAIGTTLLGQVPLDVQLRTAGDLGTPAMVSAPEAASVTELRRIAAHLPAVRRSLVGRSLPLSVV